MPFFDNLKSGTCSFLLLLVIVPRVTSAQPFTFSLLNSNLSSLSFGPVAQADLDDDGAFDVVAAGNTAPVPLTNAIYNRSAYVALSAGAPRPSAGGKRLQFERSVLPTALWHGSAAPADYDNDGDVDFVMTGATHEAPPFTPSITLYQNDGQGHFEAAGAKLPGIYGGAAAWGDYDNDGDPDLVLTGAASAERYVTKLFRNDGEDGFTEVSTPFARLAYGAARWGDYDNDHDLDLLLTGTTERGTFLSLLYRNDGAGSFSQVDAHLQGLAFSSADWGDYDDDGDLDLVLAGGSLNGRLFSSTAVVYRNDQNGEFQNVTAGITLRGGLYGSAEWGDYDNDGDLDLLLTGSQHGEVGRLSRLYRNKGADSFRLMAYLPGAFTGAASPADLDDDNDLDLLINGLGKDHKPLANLYRNTQRNLNTPPTAPSALQADVSDAGVTLSWQAGSDAQTPARGLSYNLRVGARSGGSSIKAPMAVASTGRRLLPERGNAGATTSWTLRNLPAGTYYWSVQAIDHSFKGSPFAPEGSFSIDGSGKTATKDAPTLPSRFALHTNYPNPFTTSTTFTYDLPKSAHIVMQIYNVMGQRVRTLVQANQSAGRHRLTWHGRAADGQHVSAGVYFVRMQAGSVRRTRKLMVAR